LLQAICVPEIGDGPLHQTCIFHSPQASHQAAKQISTSLAFVSPSLLMLQDYRSVCKPFCFPIQGSGLDVYWLEQQNQKVLAACRATETTLNFDKLTIFMIPVPLRRDGAQFLLFAALIGSITWRHKLLPPFAFWFIDTPEPRTRPDNIHETGLYMPNAPTVQCCQI
jgi:hypothetical protein